MLLSALSSWTGLWGGQTQLLAVPWSLRMLPQPWLLAPCSPPWGYVSLELLVVTRVMWGRQSIPVNLANALFMGEILPL